MAHWTEVEEPKQGYTITFEADFEDYFFDIEPKQTRDDGTLYNLPWLERKGYNFLGWYTEKDGGEAITSDHVFTSDTTLYGQWERTSGYYKITFDANGGTIIGDLAATTDAKGYLGTNYPKNPTREGYTFGGWYTLPNEGEQILIDYEFTEDTVIYAHWTKIKQSYTVTFDGNGGELSGGNVFNTDLNGKLTEYPEEPTRKGYIFAGWYSAKLNGDCIDIEEKIFGKNTTLYAKWIDNKIYTITFDGNGGTADYATRQTKASGKLGWDNIPSATKEGYLFDGWYTERDGGEQIYEFTEFSDDTTVYARWVESYVITFDTTGDLLEGAIIDLRTDINGRLTELPADPTLINHIFEGWYYLGTKITTDYVFSGSVTVKPRFTPNYVFTITFDGNGGTVEYESAQTDSRYGRLEAFPQAHRSGYIFDGWKNEHGNSVSIYEQYLKDTTLYAQWIDGYVITFDANGGTVDGNAKSELKTNLAGKLTELPAEPVREGYIFEGWKEEGSFQYEITTEQVFGKHTTFTAQWRKDKRYTVTFVYGNGQEEGTQECNEQGKLNSLPAVPTWQGYEFLGWFTQSEGRGEQVTTAYEFKANSFVYANWRKLGQKYWVDFYAEGGTLTGETECETDTNGKLSAFPADPTREGFAFGGWYTERDGGVKVDINYVFGKDTSVYAHWTALYAVHFNYNCSEIQDTFEYVQPNGKLGELPNPTRTGYVFKGWYTDNGTFRNSVTINHTFRENTVVYAYWLSKTGLYEITFDYLYETVWTNADGTLSEIPDVDPNTTHDYFLGWYTERDGKGELVTKRTIFSGDCTVYAHWQRVIYITFNLNGGEYYKFISGGDAYIYKPNVDFEGDYYVFVGSGAECSLSEGDIPLPIWEGHEFLGWYTSPSDEYVEYEGELVIADETEFSVDTVVYARWDYYYQGREDFYYNERDSVIFNDAELSKQSDKDKIIVYLGDYKEEFAPLIEETFGYDSLDNSALLFFEQTVGIFEIYDFKISFWERGKGQIKDFQERYPETEITFIEESFNFELYLEAVFANEDYYIVIEPQIRANLNIRDIIVISDMEEMDGFAEVDDVLNAYDLLYTRGHKEYEIFVHTKYEFIIYAVKCYCGDYLLQEYSFDQLLPFGKNYTIPIDTDKIRICVADTYEREDLENQYTITFVDGVDGVSEIIIRDSFGRRYDPEELGLECRTVVRSDGFNTFDYYIPRIGDDVMNVVGVIGRDENGKEIPVESQVKDTNGNGTAGSILFDSNITEKLEIIIKTKTG